MKLTLRHKKTAVISQSDLWLYLGGVGHGVPVASSQTEVAVAYPVQDLIRGVLGSVGKWSKTGGRHRE